jgi:hypothetical protein
MKNHELMPLLKERGQVCISIILPTHRFAPERKADAEELKKDIEEVKRFLKHHYSPGAYQPLLPRLDEAAASIALNPNKGGVGLFVSPNSSQVVEFHFPVKGKVVVSKSFALRDLLYHAGFSREYYVLEISEKVVRLFKGVIDKLEEIKDDHFPSKYEELYEYAVPARGSSYTGQANLKGFEKDKSVVEETRLRGFLRQVDEQLSRYVLEETPLVLVGAEKDISCFKALTRHQQHIIAGIGGNHMYSSDHELAQLVWPKVNAYIREEKQGLIRTFAEKVGQGMGVGGLDQVWQAAREGRGWKLLVEKDFSQPAFIGRETGALYLEAPQAFNQAVTDAVEEVVETVLGKNGEVIVLENDLLQAFGRIALITRY